MWAHGLPACLGVAQQCQTPTYAPSIEGPGGVGEGDPRDTVEGHFQADLRCGGGRAFPFGVEPGPAREDSHTLRHPGATVEGEYDGPDAVMLAGIGF